MNERDAQILKLHSEGISREVLRERFGLTSEALRSVLRRKAVKVSPGPKSIWDDERIAVATERWLKGDSASLIGAELGVSRNAVIGVLHRLGVKRPEFFNVTNRRANGEAHGGFKGVKAAKPKKAASSPRKPRTKIVPLFMEPEPMGPVPASTADAVLSLQSWHCKWPIGEPGQPAFRFCCRPRTSPRPYCEDHCKRAYKSRALSKEKPTLDSVVPVDFRRSRAA